MRYFMLLLATSTAFGCRIVCSSKAPSTLILCNPVPGKIYSIVHNSKTIVSDMRCTFGRSEPWLSHCEALSNDAAEAAIVTTHFETLTRLDPTDPSKTSQEKNLVFRIDFKSPQSRDLKFRFGMNHSECSIDPEA